MAPSKIEKINSSYNTFFTKRFDREDGGRLHFSSAMTMTGNNEDTIRDNPASYLELAEFIQNHGAMINDNLKQLWRRIVFNIAISNTDDHLRNHGFILTNQGWILSPAYDLNPSIDKNGLALNIDMNNNALSYDLAKKVGDFFRLNINQMDEILHEVLRAVASWKEEANKIGISNKEQLLMDKAFNV
jgi:serine/threonine-protein kinase HipA